MRHTEMAIKRVYTAGMALANQLRLVGRHDEAHQIEVWVLSLCDDLREQK